MRILLAVIVFAPALRLPAQVPVLPPRPPEAVTAIVNATVFPVSGPMIHRGTVIIRGAKIDAVASELPPPSGAAIVDAGGKYVTPGLVAIEASGVGVGGTDGNIADSLDPYQLALRVALASGITTANVIETLFFGFFGDEATAISGVSSAILKLTHGDLASMLVREPGLNYFAVPTRQVELNLFRMCESFRKASEHLKALKEAEAKKAQPPRAPPELGPYITILENQRPTVVAATTPEQILDVLEIREKYPFDVAISRPDEGYPLARDLALKGIPVLLKARGADFNFDLTRPILDEQGLIPIRLPSAFAEVGVNVSLLPYRRGVSLDGLAGRDLTSLHLEAAFAVKGGLDEARALEAITLNPARVLKISDRVGSLEKGKDADVLIWSRHPLDFRTFVEKAYINGKLYYEREKSPLFKEIPMR